MCKRIFSAFHCQNYETILIFWCESRVLIHIRINDTKILHFDLETHDKFHGTLLNAINFRYVGWFLPWLKLIPLCMLQTWRVLTFRCNRLKMHLAQIERQRAGEKEHPINNKVLLAWCHCLCIICSLFSPLFVVIVAQTLESSCKLLCLSKIMLIKIYILVARYLGKSSDFLMLFFFSLRFRRFIDFRVKRTWWNFGRLNVRTERILEIKTAMTRFEANGIPFFFAIYDCLRA